MRNPSPKQIVDTLQEGIWVIDENAVTTFVNGPMAAMLGYTPEEMVGRHLFSFMDERGIEISTRNLDRRQRGIREQHDFELLHRDGSRVFVAMETGPIIGADRTYRGAIAGVVDITPRRRAEEKLRASEARFRTLFEEAGLGIFLAAPDGLILQVNPAGLEMLGHTQSEMVGVSIADISHPDDREHTKKALQALIEGREERIRIEKRYVRADGDVVHGLTTGTVVRDDAGRPTMLVGVVQDVTELKRVEAELARAQKLESLGVLAGGIAHDYNNLLTAVLANVSLAREDARPGSTQARRLADAENAVLQAAALTRQLLAFSRGGAPIKRPLDLGRLVVETARFSLTGSPVAGDLDIAPDLAPVLADDGQMAQVISNLVTNAVQAQPEGGRIQIAARNRGPWVEVTVRDAGRGIPEEHLDKVFDPYFTTKQVGSGLGLAVTHSIVQRHGGHISVASRLGEGATFTVQLPRHEGPLPDAPGDAARPTVPAARILVMDDDAGIRRVAAATLAPRGCEVVEAADGAEALALYADALGAGQPFDLVIIDLIVPGALGGLELLARLRALDPGVRAIVSSGYSSDPVLARHEDHGFRGALRKPWRPADLLDVVARVLAR